MTHAVRKLAYGVLFAVVVALAATSGSGDSATATREFVLRGTVTRVVDGGIVSIPSLRLLGGDIGLPQGRAYACFAETALLALSGHRGHFSIGVPTLELVDRTRELAGFTADEFR